MKKKTLKQLEKEADRLRLKYWKQQLALGLFEANEYRECVKAQIAYLEAKLKETK